MKEDREVYYLIIQSIPWCVSQIYNLSIKYYWLFSILILFPFRGFPIPPDMLKALARIAFYLTRIVNGNGHSANILLHWFFTTTMMNHQISVPLRVCVRVCVRARMPLRKEKREIERETLEGKICVYYIIILYICILYYCLLYYCFFYPKIQFWWCKICLSVIQDVKPTLLNRTDHSMSRYSCFFVW